MIVQFMEKEKDILKFGEIIQLVHVPWEQLLSHLIKVLFINKKMNIKF
jgi:hypothetical protein